MPGDPVTEQPIYCTGTKLHLFIPLVRIHLWKRSRTTALRIEICEMNEQDQVNLPVETVRKRDKKFAKLNLPGRV